MAWDISSRTQVIDLPVDLPEELSLGPLSKWQLETSQTPWMLLPTSSGLIRLPKEPLSYVAKHAPFQLMPEELQRFLALGIASID
jgi:hypothetical protein